jgi:hypothetical protein
LYSSLILSGLVVFSRAGLIFSITLIGLFNGIVSIVESRLFFLRLAFFRDILFSLGIFLIVLLGRFSSFFNGFFLPLIDWSE